MEFKDYYKVLGVDPGADDKAIKTAYRKLARKYHPDVSQLSNAEEKFKELAEAYEVLKHKDKRAEYDELRRYGSSGKPFEPPPEWQSQHNWQERGQAQDNEDFSDFFRSIFGREGYTDSQQSSAHAQFQRRGQDVEIELPIFLEDTLSEKTRHIEYHLPESPAQSGSGSNPKSLNVKIPAGVVEGERIRLKGQGTTGIGNAPNGDLYLRVRLVPHPLFDVEGHNLILTLPLAPWEAALGTRVVLPTLSGEIKLTIPANSQAGQKLRVKGKGLINNNQRGDIFAVLKIVMPDDPDGKFKSQWEDIAKVANFSPRQEWGELNNG